MRFYAGSPHVLRDEGRSRDSGPVSPNRIAKPQGASASNIKGLGLVYRTNGFASCDGRLWMVGYRWILYLALVRSVQSEGISGIQSNTGSWAAWEIVSIFIQSKPANNIPNLEGSGLIARGYKPALNHGPSPLALTVLYHADGDQRNASLHIHQHFQLKGQVQVRRAMALGAMVWL